MYHIKLYISIILYKTNFTTLYLSFLKTKKLFFFNCLKICYIILDYVNYPNKFVSFLLKITLEILIEYDPFTPSNLVFYHALGKTFNFHHFKEFEIVY